jgi:hypothetical protein
MTENEFYVHIFVTLETQVARAYAHFHYLSPFSSISAFQIHYKGAWFNVLGLRQPYTFRSLWSEISRNASEPTDTDSLQPGQESFKREKD